MKSSAWEQVLGDGPIVAVAVHNGHELRPEAVQRMRLSDEERLREEDPFTGQWTLAAPTRLIATRSRFEVDLNRPREKAVYRVPEDAWGLKVWKDELPNDFVEESLRLYDQFYGDLKAVLETVRAKHRRFVVLDIHSYNHRRGGPEAPAEDPAGNPQVNLGTGSMDRKAWAPLVDRFLAELGHQPFHGGGLDVRENVRFKGGQLSKWVHATFPREGCALAVEFKKFFMDEWTGVADQKTMDAIGTALRATLPGLAEELKRIG